VSLYRIVALTGGEGAVGHVGRLSPGRGSRPSLAPRGTRAHSGASRRNPRTALAFL
jgi:hypothetical protein